MVESAYPGLSLARQCELVGLARSSLYYPPAGRVGGESGADGADG
jgi:hypothetical protein